MEQIAKINFWPKACPVSMPSSLLGDKDAARVAKEASAVAVIAMASATATRAMPTIASGRAVRSANRPINMAPIDSPSSVMAIMTATVEAPAPSCCSARRTQTS